MEPENIGSMVCRTVFSYDWVIPDFLNWASSKSAKYFCIGPDFIIEDALFYIGWFPNDSQGCLANDFKIRIWLGKRSQDPITAEHFSFSLVGKAESELDIGSKRNVTFKESFLNKSFEDAKFQKASLTSNFLLNKELRIRFRIKIKSKEKNLSIQDQSLVDDLCQQFEEQSLSFTDAILVCGETEIPVHRFMLAARSPVFKAMFSHEDTLEGQNKKVFIILIMF